MFESFVKYFKKLMKDSNFINRLKNSGESGASTLLSVMVIGMLVLVVSTTVASTVAFGSKMTKDRITDQKIDESYRDILNNFELFYEEQSKLATPVNMTETRTVDGFGKYRVYYSNQITKPTSAYDGQTGTGTLSANWLIVHVTPEEGDVRDFIYKQYPRGSNVVGSPGYSVEGQFIVSNNSVIDKASGVLTREAVVVNNGSTQTSTFVDSEINTNVVINNMFTAGNTFTNNVVNGNVYLNPGANALGTKVNGAYCSTTASSNTGTLGVNPVVDNNCLTPVSPLTRNTVNASAVSSFDYALTSSECTNFGSFKNRLESFQSSASEILINAQTCPTSPGFTALSSGTAKELDLKTSITLNLPASNINNVTIKNNNSNNDLVNFNLIERGAGSITNLKHDVGVIGGIFFLSNSGTLNVSNSELVGAIHNSSTTTNSRVEISNTSVYSHPIISKTANLETTMGTIVRVS